MTAATPPPPPPPPANATSRTSVGRVVLVVVGALAALIGFALLASGAVLGWAHATQRDDAGFYASGDHPFESTGYAVASEHIDLGTNVGEDDWAPFDELGTVRIVATPTAEAADLFVGIGPSADVDRFLEGSAHDRIEDLTTRPFEVEYQRVDGSGTPGDPTEATFWAATSAGPGTRTLLWDVEEGDWTVVLMNADASRDVAADVSVGIKTDLVVPIAIGLAVAGLLGLFVAAVLLILGLRSTVAAEPLAPLPPAEEPVVLAESYPARLDARLDPQLSRWLWLVKWVLVIPHVVVLVFLWAALIVLTVVAGVAILATGRYPRPIFDFNVGVMRWTWRVGYYSLAAFGTDRYPPFSLDADASYPADFAVDRPERLSRGLVLVKWWLLAIPHLVIVAIFAGGWSAGRGDEWRVVGSGGLIGVIAVIAAVVLAVRGRYPRELFHFVMGLNRWCFRVLAYVALMRDEYPPFRFDGGGTDPGSRPAVPPGPTQPEAPTDADHLVGVGGDRTSPAPPADDR